MKSKAVLLFGPQASGKTINAERIAKHYGCAAIVDEGKVQGHKLPALLEPGTLYITNQTPTVKSNDSVLVVNIQDALNAIS